MRRVSELLQQYKKDAFGWRNVLNNHFNRCKELGGPIISSISDSHRFTPAVGGGFKCKLHTKNGLSQNDGNELMIDNGSPQRTKAAALDDVCRHAMAVLLLTDASAALLQPKQWDVPTQEIVQEVITMKKAFLDLWTLPNHMSAFGDTLGDGPRVQPEPSPSSNPEPSRSSSSNYIPTHSDAERAERDRLVFDIITEECEQVGTAAPPPIILIAAVGACWTH